MNTTHSMTLLEDRLRRWVGVRAKDDPEWHSVFQTIKFAKENTPGYRDNGEPNFIHPLWIANAVAAIIEQCENDGAPALGKTAIDLIKVALCHDLLEDCPHITRNILSGVIGARAEQGVFNISIKYYDDNGQLVRKSVNEIKQGFLSDPLSEIGKYADRSHNLMTMVAIDNATVHSVVYDAEKQRVKLSEVSEFYIPAGDARALHSRFSDQTHIIPYILSARDAMVRVASQVFGELTEHDYYLTSCIIDNPRQRSAIESTLRMPGLDQVERRNNATSVDFEAFVTGASPTSVFQALGSTVRSKWQHISKRLRVSQQRQQDCDLSEQELRSWVGAKAQGAAAPVWNEVLDAIAFAKEHTQGHRDNGDLSFIHPLRIACAMAQLIDSSDKSEHPVSAQDGADLVKMALCHDLLETGAATRETLRRRIGVRSEEGVYLISDRYLGTQGTMVHKPPAQIQEEEVRDPLALVVKMGERSHNLLTMVDIDRAGVLRGIVYTPHQQRAKLEDASKNLIPAVNPVTLSARYDEKYHALLMGGRDLLARVAARVVGRFAALDYYRTILGSDNLEQRNRITNAIRLPGTDQVGSSYAVLPVDISVFSAPMSAPLMRPKTSVVPH